VMNERRLDFPVIMMTGHGDVQAAVRAMKAGALDFIQKPFSGPTLLKAVKDALSDIGRVARARETADAADLIAKLSPREREVLAALASGRSNKVIAYDLNLSVRTIEVHRGRMQERLGVQTFAEAVRLAVLAQLA
jgi:two-component system, LuxR family, response regulator FixJ